MGTCNTLSWFSTKVSMSIASSNDLILADVQDIQEALRNPTPGSPIDPLTDSHVATLKILSELISSLIPVPKPLLDPVSVPVPPLRVATPQTPSPLRVDPIAPPAGPILIYLPMPLLLQFKSSQQFCPPNKLFPKMMVHTLSLSKFPALHLSSVQLQFQHLQLSTLSLHLLQQPSKIAPVQEDAVVAKCRRKNQRKRKHTTLSSHRSTSRSHPRPLGTPWQCIQPRHWKTGPV